MYSLEYTDFSKDVLHVTSRRSLLQFFYPISCCALGHSCTNVTQWDPRSLLRNSVFQLLSSVMQVVYLCRKSRDGQTYTDGPIRCSSITLEREEHLLKKPYWAGIEPRLSSPLLVTLLSRGTFVNLKCGFKFQTVFSLRYTIVISLQGHHSDEFHLYHKCNRSSSHVVQLVAVERILLTFFHVASIKYTVP
jgi:hypothetical protein